jgi:transposase InsO family protein
MPWKEVSAMTQKMTLLELYIRNENSISDLANIFNISRKTAYKWINRHKRQGLEGLSEKSRRPNIIHNITSPETEDLILKTRDHFPAWGARKLKRYLENQGHKVPCESTFNRILKKRGYIAQEETAKRQKFIRFEHQSPNDLWQMDFKGFFRINREKCNPLTILDDHSRFSVCLKSCHNQTENTVKNHLISAFREYGLPNRMTMDNGAPWGSSGRNYTRLSVWLMRLGIKVSYSRPYHPQTQGKDERFHRSLKEELLSRIQFSSLEHAQEHFDVWRNTYNYKRPHEGTFLDVPGDRYQRSPIEYPEQLPIIEYDEGEIVRKVHSLGCITYQGHDYYLGEAFQGYYVVLRDGERENQMEIYFNKQKIKIIDLTNDWIK